MADLSLPKEYMNVYQLGSGRVEVVRALLACLIWELLGVKFDDAIKSIGLVKVWMLSLKYLVLWIK